MSLPEGSRPPRRAGKQARPAPLRLRRCRQCRQADAGRSQAGVLCEACDTIIAEAVQARVWTIQASLRQLKAEPSVSGKLREWDRILAQVEALLPYEARGILTTCPPPSTLRQEFQALRAALARRR